MNLQRKLIQKNESKISVLQIMGFVLILLGVVSLIVSSFFRGENIPSIISVSFFITMLGVAFAFPSLLEGNEGLSTMRIVVFMMTNVICMLLLKIGWANCVHSLADVGLNQYWMGVIAFVFGAKATQSFFESKMAALSNSSTSNSSTSPVDSTSNSSDTINSAIQQNQDLKTKYPNINNILIGSMNVNGHNVFCVDIHLNDNNIENIPTQLPVKIGTNQFNVPVNIIPTIGIAKTQANNGDSLINQTINGAPGTLGCFISDKKRETIYALSCCHVFSNDQWSNYSGYNVPNNQLIVDTSSGEQIGNWVFGLMNSNFDIAYAQVSNNSIAVPSGFSQPRDINDTDILHKTPVSFKGNSTPNGSGFISNKACSRSIGYANGFMEINNLILINNNGRPSSEPGDSGSLVYTTNENEPIGIIIAADTIFTYLLPITNILSITGKVIY